MRAVSPSTRHCAELARPQVQHQLEPLAKRVSRAWRAPGEEEEFSAREHVTPRRPAQYHE